MKPTLWTLLAAVATAGAQTKYPLMVDTSGTVLAPTNFWRANSNRLAELGLGGCTNGFVSTNDLTAGLHSLSNAVLSQLPATNGFVGLEITNRLVDTNLFAQAALPWATLNARLIAAAAAGAYQPTAILRDANGLATNATILWPDGSAGVLSVTQLNPTWLAVDAYTLTYPALGKTITQPAVSRDQNGNITNAPALLITP